MPSDQGTEVFDDEPGDAHSGFDGGLAEGLAEVGLAVPQGPQMDSFTAG